MEMKRSQIYTFLNKTNGKIFTVHFVKKDGSDRVMTCRTGVKKHLKGGELRYDPISRNLLPVYDMIAAGYRMINMATIYKIVYKGVEVDIVD